MQESQTLKTHPEKTTSCINIQHLKLMTAFTRIEHVLLYLLGSIWTN